MRSFDRGRLYRDDQLMSQAVQDDTSSADLYYYLGEAYRLSGDTENALKAYEQAIQVNSNFAPAYLRRAQMLLAADPASEVSQDFLKKRSSFDPNYIEAYLNWLPTPVWATTRLPWRI